MTQSVTLSVPPDWGAVRSRGRSGGRSTTCNCTPATGAATTPWVDVFTPLDDRRDAQPLALPALRQACTVTLVRTIHCFRPTLSVTLVRLRHCRCGTARARGTQQGECKAAATCRSSQKRCTRSQPVCQVLFPDPLWFVCTQGFAQAEKTRALVRADLGSGPVEVPGV